MAGADATAQSPAPGRWKRLALGALQFLLAFVGAACSVVSLQLVAPIPAIPILGFVLTVFWWLGFGGPSRFKVIRYGARLISIAHYLGAAYAGIAFGTLLGWTTPSWFRIINALALLACVVPSLLRRQRLVPLMLPLGLWVGGCFEGWYREDAAVRCEDYRRVLAQPGVRILVDSSADLAACQPGQVLRIARYPRRVWEAPDQKRLLIASQEGRIRLWPVGTPASSRFTGTICEIASTGEGEPRCFGEGKVQVFLEDEPHDRLFLPAWGQSDERQRGVLWELPLHEPARILRELRFPLNVGEGYIVPSHDVIVLETDDADASHPVRASSLEPLPTLPFELCPGSTRFDPTRNEGVFCGGGRVGPEGWGIAQAFQGWPLKARALGTFDTVGPLAVGMSWGCDWDPESRRVFVAVPNAGAYLELDYDTGRMRALHFVGFGMRDVLYDKARDRLYMTNYLSGAVLEIDPRTGKRLREWEVGRFSRFMTRTRNGQSLLVASNVGVVQIPLD